MNLSKLNSVLHSNNTFTYLLSLSASFIGIVLNLFLARVLEAEAYGEIQYAFALATTFSQFILLGLNTFIVRDAKNERHNGEIFNKCFSVYLIILIFAIPIMLIITSFDESLSLLSRIYVILVAVLIGANSLISAYFQGCGKYRLTVILENLIPKFGMLVIALSFWLLSKMTYYQNAYLLIYIVIYGMIAIPLVIKNFKHFNFEFIKSDIASIFFFFGVTVTYSLGNNITKVIQGGIYENDVALAIISVSLSIITLVNVFTAVLNNLIKPIFAKMKRNNDMIGLIDVYRFDTRFNTYISIPLYLFFIICSEQFLLFFGETYTVYPGILSILAMANMVGDITGPNGTMLAMAGNEKWELINGIIYFTVYIASVFAFSYDRIYGLCLALLASQILVNIAKFIEIRILYNVSPFDSKTVFTIILILAVDGLVIYFVNFIKVFYVWLIVGVVTGVTLIFINCFVLSLYRKTDFKRFLEIKL